ncbi:protein-tyrosine phosphatase [Palleronia marisminoris]|uniref:protein-tyrosine-phosphatase n=2 Tax=Palleronia marisminoris TaxID=315423 RepID=A0A1Y5RT45_9RHOB|nr:protein-tyrosine phosphatase [Palleronia marisminoris]SLN24807.1 Low molecular weight protein-tyrosine-phosphatase YfkJ [Palleronia marisminoris]
MWKWLDGPASVGSMTKRILFVCLGNICRSPAAEVVLRVKASEAGLELEIDSAGTGDWHVGEPPHPPMVRAARARGYDMSALRGRQVTAVDFARFDLIVVADEANLRDVEALRPSGDTTPVRLFAPYAGGAERSIPDPYHTGDFDGALQLVERAAAELVAQLQ